jgi:hypothetical protein
MFGGMTSLTGGGGLSSSSSSSAGGGDNTFANGFDYKNGADNSSTNMLLIGGLVLVALFALKAGK